MARDLKQIDEAVKKKSGISVDEYLLWIRKWPQGRELFGAGSPETVRYLMEQANVQVTDLDAEAERIYEAKQQFLSNTGFVPPPVGPDPDNPRY